MTFWCKYDKIKRVLYEGVCPMAAGNRKSSNKRKTQTKKERMAEMEKAQAFRVEVTLWIVVAAALLLFISNLGFGGAVGKTVSGFLFVFLFFCPRASLSRFPQALRYRLMLQRCQCPLSGFVVQLCQPFLQFGVQLYPSVQLCRGAAGCGVWEIGLCQVTHVDCFHVFVSIQCTVKKLPAGSWLTTYG